MFTQFTCSKNIFFKIFWKWNVNVIVNDAQSLKGRLCRRRTLPLGKLADINCFVSQRIYYAGFLNFWVLFWGYWKLIIVNKIQLSDKITLNIILVLPSVYEIKCWIAFIYRLVIIKNWMLILDIFRPLTTGWENNESYCLLQRCDNLSAQPGVF